jgi:pimeloyl-ACP methyl ester carboxylesterase
VVVDIAPVAYADRLSMFAEAMRAVDTLHAASREEISQRLSTQLHDSGIVAFLMQNLEVRNARFDWRLNLGAILSSIEALSEFPTALRTLHFPRTLRVIAGARSDYVTQHDGSEFAPMFKRVQVEMIDGAGHWVHAERPQAFVAALQRALQVAAVAAQT